MQEESLNRLEAMRARRPGLFAAAAKAVAEGRIDPQKFGLTKKQVEDAANARAGQLESLQRESIDAPMAGLEAIVKLVGRPPLLVENNAVVLQPLDDFPAGTDTKIKAVEPLIPSIGRVEFINYDMAWGGTGWVVDKKADGYLVLTNRHVAKLVAKRYADGTPVFMRSPMTGIKYGAQIDFNEEVGAKPQDARPAKVFEIVYIADDLAADMALLKVKQVDGATWKMPHPVPLAANEAANDELVALVGYPAYDSRNDADAMHQYFKDLYDVKRFAPGRIMKPTADSVLSHDCTSLGGNSGSTLISLEQKKAVGLHFAGSYGISNSAVGVGTIKKLLTGKLVTIGQIPGGEGMAEAADGVHKPSDLAGRSGFDTNFLGKEKKLSTPWPKLPSSIAQDLVKPSDATSKQPHELRYTHFSVLFSGAFRLPVLTAVNIDGKNSVRIKRAGDKWFLDGRIDKTLQHTQAAYKDAEIDRGHMVRREDPNWGDDAPQADGRYVPLHKRRAAALAPEPGQAALAGA